ncbi:NUDIX hydrolase [Pyrococcus furiosus DSM 3638]|uniref:Mutt putative n=3 Tax=Pyrococcus furiosus TaxID=2261 RepID=Q8U0J7_PYRFU|nr:MULTISPECIES: NUDIX hydrolase [Pyrococcus]AAL81714.1 mutt putative [Pyrococcus furiosus DSM 3638]AFN04372.1 mutt [Pyrococcus furiosus COM1]MDK2869696.1 8-oxo-dGTP diphosphatase [Pyrococcus sp.]QEK79213.1 NUDIX hydrolase [Pyrococcus furiosus DSM 3638]
MDRYVLLVKAPKEYDISKFREEVEKIAKDYGLKVEAHKCIGVTVDIVIIHNGNIVLIERKNDPYKGYLALPGGFVEYGEKVEEAAIREAKEETGLDVKLLRVVGVYSDPNRDPRGHTITVAFLAIGLGEPKAGDDAKKVHLIPIEEIEKIKAKLAFDHAKIIEDALTLR